MRGSENMKKLISLDDLANKCGYFCDCESNNGYGCNNKGNEEKECHSYCCPIATDASYNDLLELDSELAKEYEYQLEYKDPEEEGLDSDWMVQHSE
jgi:hypothetical protein